MRILVFQHIPIEHPGVFRDFMAADGIGWDAVELDEGDAIPELGDYDALIAMGGPMDVWEEDEYPWLVPEKAAIREAVAERHMPFLGFCLGHQLLAAALGGEVGPMDETEVGVLDVDLTKEGVDDAFMRDISPRFKCLQWHGAEIKAMPPDGTALARSPTCAVQALRVGHRAYGLQYHVEITAETVSSWAAVPAYQESLDQAFGPAGKARFEAEVKSNLAAFNRDAKRLYDNFMGILQPV